MAAAPGPARPLLSWRDGQAKQTILDFVSEVTPQGSPDFVAPEARIATFDNDRTLWAEQPIYFQLAFALDRLRTLAAEHPEWREPPPRWTAYDAKYFGVGMSEEVPMITTERAYTSPIWYTP
jgi:hypothetical protein